MQPHVTSLHYSVCVCVICLDITSSFSRYVHLKYLHVNITVEQQRREHIDRSHHRVSYKARYRLR